MQVLVLDFLIKVNCDCLIPLIRAVTTFKHLNKRDKDDRQIVQGMKMFSERHG